MGVKVYNPKVNVTAQLEFELLLQDHNPEISPFMEFEKKGRKCKEFSLPYEFIK